MEILIGVIIGTSTLLGVCLALTISSAWTLGGEFYITKKGGRRKSKLERLLDGFEVLQKL